MEEYLEGAVRRGAVDPVGEVRVDSDMWLRVSFRDGRVARFKIDEHLRLFFATMQGVSTRRSPVEDASAVSAVLGFNGLFGFRAGDVAVFEDGRERLVTRFS